MLKSAKPKVGECFYARKGPLLTLSWKEKKSLKNPCLMLTTGIGAGMVNHTRRNGQVKELPKAVSSYNQHMGGVDLLDQMVDHVAGERAFHKFWKCFFFFIIDRMVFCSYIVYEQNSSAQCKLTRFQFMCTLIEELCASSEDQETAGVVPSASQHSAVLLPGKREKDCGMLQQVNPQRKEKKPHPL